MTEQTKEAWNSGDAFEAGDATSLPWSDESVDAAVSGLVLNFVPDGAAMVRKGAA